MTYKIMIVDDQFVSRELFKLYIEQLGEYEVLYCIDTAMFADTYALKAPLDLVIMDILMNDGSNGLDAAKKIGIESFWYKDVSEETLMDIVARTLKGESIYPDNTPVVTLGLAKSSDFTPKEIEVLRLLTTGAGNDEIADKLDISQNTVKTHVKHLLEKTGFETRTQLAIQSRVTGFVIED